MLSFSDTAPSTGRRDVQQRTPKKAHLLRESVLISWCSHFQVNRAIFTACNGTNKGLEITFPDRSQSYCSNGCLAGNTGKQTQWARGPAPSTPSQTRIHQSRAHTELINYGGKAHTCAVWLFTALKDLFVSCTLLWSQQRNKVLKPNPVSTSVTVGISYY